MTSNSNDIGDQPAYNIPLANLHFKYKGQIKVF